jgi:hypothetical protein
MSRLDARSRIGQAAVVPTYHPAGLNREKRRLEQIRKDFEAARTARELGRGSHGDLAHVSDLGTQTCYRFLDRQDHKLGVRGGLRHFDRGGLSARFRGGLRAGWSAIDIRLGACSKRIRG